MPLGYKPTQLPKYNAITDPTQFLMAYEATIASAGGDDSTMAKSFVMACEGVRITGVSDPRGEGVNRVANRFLS